MKLAVLGATGMTGKLIVQQALADGHEVAALARNAGKLGITHPKLRVVEGQATDANVIDQTITGADAVISALGQTKTSQKDLLSVVADQLVPAMARHGIRRFITLTGAGVSDAKDGAPSFGRKFMLGLMRLLARHVLADAELHAQKVRASDLDFVIARPPRLTNNPKQGRYQSGYLVLGPSSQISRADLAAFMLSEAVSPTFHRAAPMVAGT